MIDIKKLREDPTPYRENAKKKFQDPEVIDKVLSLDESWRQVKNDIDQKRAERNKVSQEINTLKKEGKNADAQLSRAKEIPQELKELEEKEQSVKEERDRLLKDIPNIMHPDVPLGKDDSQNVEQERFGPEAVSKEVKAHQIAAEDLGVADFESSATTSGTGFYYIEGDLALLNQALIRYGVDTMYKKGFRYVETPLMLRGHVVQNVVDLGDQENQIYKIEGEDLYLIGTSEHSLIGRFVGRTVKENQLPIKQTSYSMCFRREKGSHGLDERGLFRTHQFNKVEMVVICKPEDSMKHFKELQDITVEIFTGLGLPTRVLKICSGDLGNLKHIQVDVEVWSPRRNEFIEVGSCSNLTDAQARGLGIKADNGKDRYTPHTLNNTAIATSRALVAILENYQNEDGSITVPEVLRPYMHGIEKIESQK
ncbi:MAG: serine--tRNA ligase [Nanoarchaeota archaeon]|nr:serine--tRNA ligase [Nanoarchaeota archaeon]